MKLIHTNNIYKYIVLICFLGVAVTFSNVYANTNNKDVVNNTAVSLASSSNSSLRNSSDSKISIVTTIYPFYNWIQELTKGLDDKFSISLLNKNGLDIHNYQPTVKDMATTKDADIVLFIGGTGDMWIDKLFSSNSSENTTLIKASDLLASTLIRDDDEDDDEKEEIAEANNSKHEEHKHHHEHEHHHEFDEHVWLSFNNANIIVKALSQNLQKALPQTSDTIKKNEEELLTKLNKLADDYRLAFAEHKNSQIVIADNFPFVYLFKEMNISYKAAFPNCEARNTVNFRIITTMTEALKNSNTKTIFVLKNGSKDLAKAIINNINDSSIATIELDSMQSYDKSYENASYVEIMIQNLEQLKKAFK